MPSQQLSQEILIIDDEPDIRELLEITLGRMGLNTTTAEDLASAHEALRNQSFNLCLTDMKLPDGNGLSIVEYIQDAYPHVPVAVITAFGSMDTAISALKAGAFDFISKPIDLDVLRGVVQSALNLKPSDSSITDQSRSPFTGDSAAMNHLRQQIAKLARSQAPVYIHGESGSGKELVARSIHELGSRGQQPFVAVNCGAIPKELMESEFFGHIKGSFTGATADKPGLFQTASGGTLFLDEVAELPLEMQVKLLRAIQEKSIRPVGAEKEIPVDVRILSATHRNLQSEVEAKHFRQDLFFRINVIQLNVPSLRDRHEDIAPLCEVFLQRFNQGSNTPAIIDPAALEALQQYHFPGNVRELENILERAFTLCENQVITPGDLQFQDSGSATIAAAPAAESTTELTAPSAAANAAGSQISGDSGFHPAMDLPAFESLDSYLEDIEKAVILQALESCRWNKTAAAKKLGITFRQLRYKLKKLELD